MPITGSEAVIGPAWQTPTPRASSTPGLPSPRFEGDGFGDRTDGKDRVQATRLKDPATTVPKGVVIQAVLETALDSTRAGFARAIVSRDVFAFDGGQVLIPRGSRLVGEYKADLTLGQKRVLVQWQRLMRPDGVLMNLDSPAADPLGRAGVGGKVNSHFLERFAGSILQSTLNIGAQLASQRVSRETYVLALPGTTQGLVSTQGDKIAPTIKVRQGSSVSVFVARDLDFTVTDQ
jgi:type IV secretion system protein VirB10